jgi:hypothetical protein
MDLPSALTTFLWSITSQDDRLVAAFKGRTIRAILRALRREAETQRARNEISAIRPEWAALVMSASTMTVTANALLLNRVRFRRGG